MKIINGKKIANKILDKLRREIGERGLRPGLAVILANNDSASQLYVRNKERAAKKAGVRLELYNYKPSNITNELMLARVKKMNKSKKVHGIIVQLPLPKHLDTNKIIAAIDPQKDVDGFCPKTCHVSPVALSVIRLLEATKRSLKNKKAVLFVKSEVFASPIKKLLEEKGVKVKIFLITTPSALPLLKGGGGEVGEADIIVTALGKPHILKNKMIKNGAIVVDVGITLKKCEETRSPEETESRYNIIGDFDFRGSEKKKGFYTPVPGGVGPMTVAMLLDNVVKASQ